MGLLNYTTKVSVDTTIGEIQRLLVKAGARSIMVDYDEHGEPVALAFQVQTKIGQAAYRLPANIDAALTVLLKQHKHRAGHTATPNRAQAARVGWRILKDWVEAQMALLETRMILLDEVMLPWMVTASGQTVYQLFEQQQLALPAATGR